MAQEALSLSQKHVSAVQAATGAAVVQPRGIDESYLDETNVGGLLAEALTADVEAVLADQTSGVGADAAVVESQPPFSQSPCMSSMSVLHFAPAPHAMPCSTFSSTIARVYDRRRTTRGSPCRKS